MRYRSFVFDSARWDAYRHRPGDIIITTPAKCGTTWTQNIVALLVFPSTTFPRPMVELSPWIDQNTHDLEATIADLETRDHRRFLKSHTPLDGLPWHDDVTYVVVGRDPRDVAVSWANHVDNTDIAQMIELRADKVGLDDLDEMPPYVPPPEDPVERWWSFMTQRAEPEFAGGLQELVAHLTSYWERRDEPNIVLLHYADLEADLEGEMRRLADRLGIEVPEARWPELVDAARFDSMQARASDLAPNAGEFWKDDTRFFRRGGSGQWQAVVGDTPETDERYQACIRELTDDEAFLSWLHRP